MQSITRPLSFIGTALTQFRSYGKHNKKFLYKDGVKHGQIFYYPR